MGRLTLKRVKFTIRQSTNRAVDSRRLFEIQEALIEVLGILREIRGIDPAKLASRMRNVEREMPRKIGAAMDRLTGPDGPGNAA